MDNEIKFLPRGRSAVLSYAVQVNGVLTSPGFDPATLKLAATDVAELGSILAEEQALVNATNNAISQARSNTKVLSGPNGIHAKLVAKLRVIANNSRASLASPGVLASIGVSRKTTNPSPRRVGLDAPEFTLSGVSPGIMNIRFRVGGSAAPRARAANAIGVQVAWVDDTIPAVKAEADNAPNQFVPRSPASVDSTNMPPRVRLYARWMTRRGETSAWSGPLAISVI